MQVITKQRIYLFVDRLSQRWVVRDSDGAYWTIPTTQNAWQQRVPFVLTEDTELERIPDHYRYMLGLPD
jgi:hypothetical protein